MKPEGESETPMVVGARGKTNQQVLKDFYEVGRARAFGFPHPTLLCPGNSAKLLSSLYIPRCRPIYPAALILILGGKGGSFLLEDKGRKS